MPESYTTRYNFTKPEPQHSPTTWGTYINANLDSIDALVYTNQTGLNTLQGQVSPNDLIVSSKPSTSTPAYLWFMNGEVTVGQQERWLICETAEPETGGNAGSNLVMQNFGDAGAAIGTAVEFIRASGQAAFQHAVSVGGAFTANSTATVSGYLTASAGASITGQLTVNGTIAGNNVYFGQPAATDFCATVSGVVRILQWGANWYDGWNSSNGLRSWVGGSSTLMQLDSAGNLNTLGSVTAAANVTASGTIAAAGNLISSSGIVASKAAGGGNANFVMQDNSGAARGYCYWTPANFVSLVNVTASNSFQLDGPGNCIATPTGGNNFVVTAGNGLKPGGGSWGAYSDARIKTVNGDYTSGLEAVLKLRPVTYVYKGDYAKGSGGKEFVGLVADEAMAAIPEMVSLQKGTIDGVEVDDLKVLDTTALIFALVNAVRDLKAEIEALKAR